MTRSEFIGRRGPCLLVSLLVLSLVVESHSFFIRRQVANNVECRLNGYLRNPGSVVTIHRTSVCWELSCNMYGWIIYQAGCNDREKGVCYPEGTNYVGNCTTYTCTKSSRNGYISYESTPVSKLCEDYNGVCFESGSMLSTRSSTGVLRHNCNCTIEAANSVMYRCP